MENYNRTVHGELERSVVDGVYNKDCILAQTNDLVSGENTQYGYADTKLTAAITFNANNSMLKHETFVYDDAGRMTKDSCIYDMANSKTVKSVINYAMEEITPVADNRVSEYAYYLNDNSPVVHTANGYDRLNRMTSKTHTIGNQVFTKTMGYSSTRPTSVTEFGVTTTYGYDDMGRISSIDNGEAVTYEYDEYGQLIRENNKTLDKTFQYVYNGIGNIESVNTYAYTPAGTELSGTPVTTAFVYSNTTHPDRLTKVGSNYISYNSIGCMTAYQSRNFRWDKGKLAGFTRGSMSQPGSVYEDCTYTYNGYGQRVSKTYTYDPNPAVSNDGSYTYTTTYKYDHSGRLINEHTVQTHEIGGQSAREITYLYDESGVIGCVFTANGASATYYYQRNLLGDVVAIYDTNGNKKVEYAYDAFGNCTTISGATSTMGKYNPFRYRGYYFDTETGWYFLNARYYAPELRRFISPADISTLNPQVVNGLNLYVYANSEPVNIQYSAAPSNGLNISEKMVDFASSASKLGTSFFNGFVFPTLSFNSLLKNTLLSLSEVSGTLFYSLTSNGQVMIHYHQIFDGIDGFTILDNLPHPVNSLFKRLGITLAVIDTFSAGFDSYNSGHSFGQGVLNLALTGGKNYMVYRTGTYVTAAVGKWAGAKLGASIGSWAGPVGMVAGVTIGTVVGYLIDEFGDAIIDWIVGWFD